MLRGAEFGLREQEALEAFADYMRHFDMAREAEGLMP